MGLLTFSINVTQDGCVDHQEGIADELRKGVQELKDATPDGVLLGSGKLATELDRRGRNAIPARADSEMGHVA